MASSPHGQVSLAATGEFVVLHSTLLRRYLDLEFGAIPLPFAYSLERVVDDLVLISFLVGNDFLPHPPGLQIENNGLDRLFGAYKKLLPVLGGYLVEARQPVATRLGRLLAEVATSELAFLIERPEAALAAPEGAREEAPEDGGAVAAAEVEEDDRAAKEEARAREAAEEQAIMDLAAAAAEGGGRGTSVRRSAPAASTTIVVKPHFGPAVAPWKTPGGFSFAKVLKGERLADRMDASRHVEPAASAPSAPPADPRVLGGASSVLKGMLGLGPASAMPDSAEAQAALSAIAAGGGGAKSAEAGLGAAAAELERQRPSALTGAALEAMEEDERDAALGERIYAVIQHLDDTQVRAARLCLGGHAHPTRVSHPRVGRQAPCLPPALTTLLPRVARLAR